MHNNLQSMLKYIVLVSAFGYTVGYVTAQITHDVLSLQDQNNDNNDDDTS